MAFDLTPGIVSDLAGRVLASSLGSVTRCTESTVALLARSRRPTIQGAVTRAVIGPCPETRGQVGRANAEPRRSEGSLPAGADHRATPLYSVGPQGPDHDAVMRIGGKAPGGGPMLRNGATPWPVSGDRHLGSSAETDDVLFVRLQKRVLLSRHAARKTTPAGASPVVTMRHKAISSFLARATIRVLRVRPRASAVRARYHCASALSF